MRVPTIALTWLTILVLPCAAQFSNPAERGKALRDRILRALDHPALVEVSEHTSRFDQPFDSNFKERTLRTVQLNKQQIESLRLALPLSEDRSGTVSQDCIFKEHHVITIRSKNGNVLTMHLCFECGELALNKQNSRVMPDAWPESLAKFIGSIGMHPHGPWGKH